MTSQNPNLAPAVPPGVWPGKVALFGSGETAASGRQAHRALMEALPSPIHAAILETPAGFQSNSAWVAGRLAEFLEQSLQNFHPQVVVIPARRRDGPHSTQDRQLATPLLAANYIFAGPGSPSYAARHLADTWVWHIVTARHRCGAALALASAAAIAASAFTLPVYEIYKAGDDPHWLHGLDLFGPYGLELAIVTHWDNREGGDNLDTSRAFIGAARMAQLEAMLPPTATTLGIDEHTAIVLDLAQGTAQVFGHGRATIRRADGERTFGAGETFPLQALGDLRMPTFDEGLPPDAVSAVLEAEQAGETLPSEVAALVEAREAARRAQDWKQADLLRGQLGGLGYIVEDTPQGPRWRRSAAAT